MKNIYTKQSLYVSQPNKNLSFLGRSNGVRKFLSSMKTSFYLFTLSVLFILITGKVFSSESESDLVPSKEITLDKEIAQYPVCILDLMTPENICKLVVNTSSIDIFIPLAKSLNSIEMIMSQLGYSSQSESGYSTLGIAQAMALLNAVSDSSTQQKMAPFLSNTNLISSLSGFNKSMNQKRRIRQGIHALMSSHLNISKESNAAIERMMGTCYTNDFSVPGQLTDTIEAMVAIDTNSRISLTLKSNKNTAFVILYTLYIKTDWLANEIRREGNDFMIPAHDNLQMTILKNIENREDAHPVVANQQEKNFISKTFKKEKKIPYISTLVESDLTPVFKKAMPSVFDKSFNIAIFKNNFGFENTTVNIDQFTQKIAFHANDRDTEVSLSTVMVLTAVD